MNSKSYQAYALHNYEQIPQCAHLRATDKEAIEVVGRVLPFKTNNYVTDELIDWSNIPNDPIYTLTFPRRDMLLPTHYEQVKQLLTADKATLARTVSDIRLSLNPNPAGQEHNVPELNGVRLEGMQHKYRETVLLFPRQGQTCHAYCTFCFRWPQFSGMQDLKFSIKQELGMYVDYIKAHPAITDVLFTGGDPMTMSAETLRANIAPFLAPGMEQLKTIRIGTKSLAYWPYRYTADKDSDEIIRLFEEIVAAGKHLSIMAHFNHPVELSTAAVQAAIARIRTTGAQIRTQSPILKNINNDPTVWATMLRKQVDLGCIPYYMFVPRNTGAKQFFEIPLVESQQIFRKAYQQVSGICRSLRGPSMSDNAGKIQILGTSTVRGEEVLVLRFIQGRNPDWVAHPFFAHYDATATWFDQLKPAFGEKEFFFERELNTYFE